MADFTKEPEIKLWREVIKIALRDAGMNLANGKLASIRSARTPRQAELDRAQAVNFLTAKSGEWEKSRVLVCSMAMLCPDRLRSNYLKLLKTTNKF